MLEILLEIMSSSFYLTCFLIAEQEDSRGKPVFVFVKERDAACKNRCGCAVVLDLHQPQRIFPLAAEVPICLRRNVARCSQPTNRTERP